MNFGILIPNHLKTDTFVDEIFKGKHAILNVLDKKGWGIFSENEIAKYIDEEELHDIKVLTKNSSQALKTMSSGERKKALLNHLLDSKVKGFVFVNPFDNLDVETQAALKREFEILTTKVDCIQIVNRIDDLLTSTKDYFVFENNELHTFESKAVLLSHLQKKSKVITTIPLPLKPFPITENPLIKLKNINVSFENKRVLNHINWIINKGDFWQLKGPNGSGKSTILNLITGDSHKGYGQDLTLFGQKKGSGESVWDLKKYIGYFTPAMVDRFKGYHTLKHMLISGLHDSVGLYKIPSEIEKAKSIEWLKVLGLESKKDYYFHQLSLGQKRLLMTARAMIKHPPLLILDEPTVGLDDNAAWHFISLINAYSKKSDTAIIYVSHRTEIGLRPKQYFELIPTDHGSLGVVKK
ncbi:hypothetical protein GCM10011414_21620 [Croceivirga lutea]|uniref:ABC transporter ATP-binding protein n=1 Tax=Croceivirga lutea TaxID=1775167 RepID=UPI00163AF040|nr:ATP-binding cassette domain-containing protein [Croceivirga lutea]GGG51677.1 hypothetical protein GCM10011414_21620 [Croceivirga lutea]